MNSNILYKVNGNDDCAIFLNIVRYLYSIGFDIRSKIIVEKNFPSNIDKYRSHMKLNAVFSTIGWVAFCGLFDATLVSTYIAAPDDQAAVKEVVRTTREGCSGSL